MATAANIHLSLTLSNGRKQEAVYHVRSDGYPESMLDRLKQVAGIAGNQAVPHLGALEDFLVNQMKGRAREGAYPYPDSLSYSYMVKREQTGEWSLWMATGLIDESYLIGPIGF
jgi:hypothetical protein